MCPAANTKIESALAAGKKVRIEAILRPDGSLVALSVKSKVEWGKASKLTVLEGQFEGVDGEGNWVVGGTRVAINNRTDSDGLPREGEQVKVKALVQSDGSLIAREIENEGLSRQEKPDREEISLEGTFQKVDQDGSWVVNGIKVTVGVLTRLKGTPAVGQRVEVEALRQPDGTLVASKIEGETERPETDKKEVRITGRIERVENDGTLVINGYRVSRSVLTFLDSEPEIGRFVKVAAVLGPKGSLVAREVESDEDQDVGDDPKFDRVRIQGVIQQINEDGSLLVNGLKIVLGESAKALRQVAEGSFIRVDGELQEDGSILARRIKGEHNTRIKPPSVPERPFQFPREVKDTLGKNETRIDGIIERVLRNADGRPQAILVRGLEIRIELVTRIEGALRRGVPVNVSGLLIRGKFLATRIQQSSQERDSGKDRQVPSLVRLEGIIVEDLQQGPDGRVEAITVNGIVVKITSQSSKGC